MRSLGSQRIGFHLGWGLGCLLAACSPYLEREAPGVFYDVQLAASPPSTLCEELAGDAAAQTHFMVKWHGPLRRPDQCAALLNDSLEAPRREIWITTDAARNLLFVELRELGPSGPVKPSPETKEMGKRLEGLIHARFPAAKVTQGKRLSGLLAP